MTATFDTNALIDSMKDQLKEIAKRELGGFISRFLADVNVFITVAVSDLQVWAAQLSAGEITQAEFTFLVGGLEDRMALHAITEAGIAIVTIQRIRKAVIDLLISSVLKFVFP